MPYSETSLIYYRNNKNDKNFTSSPNYASCFSTNSNALNYREILGHNAVQFLLLHSIRVYVVYKEYQQLL